MLAASLTALAVSVFGLRRLKMTGFAWTTAALAATSYLSLLLLFNWLEQKPEIQALWCLPGDASPRQLAPFISVSLLIFALNVPVLGGM